MSNNRKKRTVEAGDQRTSRGKRGLLKPGINGLRRGLGKKRWVSVGIGVGVVLVVVGTVGALNGWFGGGGSIPSDTFTRGLVGYWAFEEGSGSVAYDSSGNENNASGYKISTFTSNGTFTVPTGVTSVEVLVVAGGGGGGYDYGGGGGAGGLIYAAAHSVSPGDISVTVGAGGACQTNGANSVFDSLTAVGGGRGGTRTGTVHGSVGGSGGGGCYSAGVGGAGTESQGYAGGNAVCAAYQGAGGGGAGGIGENAFNCGNAGGDGGVGLQYSISGANTYYAGGGGGAYDGVGGAGGGGDASGFAGTANTGGGGGGSMDGSCEGGAGGSGIVIVKYLNFTGWTTGKYGSAFSFNGTGDYVGAGDVYSGVKSVEFWIKADNTTKKILGLNDTQYIEVSDATLAATGWTSPTIYVDGVEASTIDTSTWHHIVITTDTGINATSTDLGRYSTNYYDGILDEVRFYSRVLSASEVRYHYNRGGPVAHWKFDEGNGTTTFDGTDNDNDGTLGDGTCDAGSGTCPAWTAGKYGTGLLFDGENDYVEIPHSSDLDITESVTVSAWVKTNAAGVYQNIVDKHDGSNIRPYELQITSANVFRFSLWDGTNYPIAEGTTEVEIGKWYHAVGIRDRAQDRVLLYIDGVLEASVDDTITDSVSTDTPVAIGERLRTLYFNGLIDDVRIYNYARTPDEIRLDYNAGFGVRFGGSPADDMTRGLVGYWNMDEGDGDFVYDQSDYENFGHVGPAGKSLQFDGVNDYVAIPATGISSGDPWTAELWFNSNVVAWKHLLYAGAGYHELSIQANGKFMYRYNGSDELKSFTMPILYTTGSWYHVVFVANASGYENKMNVYGNGRESTSGWSTIAGAGGTGLNVAWIASDARPFPGKIDEVRIYNRALSADEIAEHYKGIFSDETGLVGYWPLDDGSGGIAYDKSGNLNNGTLHGSTWVNNAPKWTQGAPAVGGGWQGTALEFDGVDDAVEVTDATGSALDITDDITIEAWVKIATTNTDEHMIVYKSGDYLMGYRNGTINFYSYEGDMLYGSTTLEADTWYHFTVLRRGSIDEVYLNGVREGSTSNTGSMGTSNNSLYIGSYYISGSYMFDGIIDEVKIYNRALSAEEIRYHYNRGGPVAHWKFDEGSGTTTYDGTNNNNDVALGGGATAAVPTWVTGKYGSALNFDGTDDYVSMPTSSSTEITNAITLEVWVKPNGVDEYGYIISKFDGSTAGGYGLYWFGNNERVDIYSGPSGTAQSNAVFTDSNIWVYVAVTVDSSGNVIFYRNGSNAGTGTLSISSNNLAVLLGNRTGGTSATTYFNGSIDDMRIYNYARTAEEIRLDYNQGLAARFGPTYAGCDLDPAGCMTKGLVGYWGMDEGAGDFVYDQSDYENFGHVEPAGKSLQFDGGDDHVKVGSDASLSRLDYPLTVLLWIKPDMAINDDAAILFTRVAYTGWGLMLRFDSRLDFWADSVVVSSSGFTIQDGVWQHVAVVADGETVTFYYQGKQYNNPAFITPLASVGGASTISQTTPAYNYGGLMDEVRVYNRALSATEIAEHHKGIFSNETGLVGYWPLDDGIGITAYDKSQYKNNGILTNFGSNSISGWQNNAPRWTAGIKPLSGGYQSGGALEFDGADDYVDCGNNSSLDFGASTDFTIEAWVNPSSDTSNYRTIVSKWNDGTPWTGYYLRLDITTGYARFEIDDGDESAAVVDSTNHFGGGWVNIVGLIDRDSATGMNLYINGVLVNTADATALESSLDTVASCRIGIGTNSLYPFNGLIDEVRVYNRALSEEEVRYHYNRGGPVAHWKFDEGSGTTTYDGTNNNNDGALGGGATAAVPTWVTGKYGSALLFDGVDDYVDAGNDDSLKILGDTVTVTFWLYRNRYVTYEAIITKRQLGCCAENGWAIMPSSNSDRVRWIGKTGGTWNWITNDSPVLQLNTWYHIAMVYNGSTGIIYTNAVPNAPKTTTGDLIENNEPLRIGGRYTNYFSGGIDDVRIYNYARSQSQILQDYNAGLSTYFK